MKHLQTVTSLLMSLMVASSGWAQDQLTARNLPVSDQVEAARRPYMVSDEGASHANSAANPTVTEDESTTDTETLAQLSRRRPVRSHPPRTADRRMQRAMIWPEPGNARGAAIGALIGGGLGVAMGIAANQDHHPQANAAAVLIFGAIGALVGAVAGGSWPSHSWRTRRPWQDEDDLESNSGPHRQRQGNSQPQAATPAKQDASASGSRETSAQAQILENPEPSAPAAASELRQGPRLLVVTKTVR